MCKRCFKNTCGAEDPAQALEMARATIALEAEWFASFNEPRPTRAIRTIVVEGVEYDVVYDGT